MALALAVAGVNSEADDLATYKGGIESTIWMVKPEETQHYPEKLQLLQQTVSTLKQCVL